MIHAHELRVGNWFDSNGKYYQVLTRTFKYVAEDSNVQPIPLTPEILDAISIGADDRYFEIVKKKLHGRLYWTFGKRIGKDVAIEIIHNTNAVARDKGRTYLSQPKVAYYTDIKFLHQLQNLYYALTGQELEVAVDKLELKTSLFAH